jgi:lactate dehydrogenase-like 2-hydroxyacid dehydrogenase
MAKPSLLITRPLPDVVVDAARAVCDVTMQPVNDYYRADDCAMAMVKFDAVLATLGDSFGAAAFEAALQPRCRLIANFGVGYNHIDVRAAAKKGMTVTNTPGAVTDATADIALTLMLMTARRTSEGERMLRAGKWRGWHPTQMLGTHIGGKTLGIIGMGRIGQAVARRAHFGFGMEVVFFNRSLVKNCGIPGTRQMASIAEVMAASDVISINVPGSPENHHLIDADILSAAKPGAILVNTARGDVINESALIAALENGALAGAGLDVYEHEPHVPEALLAMENVVLLPHLGTNALEVRTQMGLMAVENIAAFFAGEKPPNTVNA